MRRIAVFLQLLFYSFIFIPVSHSVAPLSVVEFDNVVDGAPTIFSACYLIGLTGLFSILFYLNYDKAFIINVVSSLFLFVPVIQYISWHNMWIPCLTAIPFALMTVSAVLQLRKIIYS